MEEEILVEGLEDNEPFILTFGDTQDVYDEEQPEEEVVEEIIVEEE
jgi:hypothetical protein